MSNNGTKKDWKMAKKIFFFLIAFTRYPLWTKAEKKFVGGCRGYSNIVNFGVNCKGQGVIQIPAFLRGVLMERSVCCLFFLPTKRPYRTVIAVLVPSGRLVGRNTKKSFLRSGRNVWYRSGDLNCTLPKPPLIQFFIYLNLVFAIKI